MDPHQLLLVHSALRIIGRRGYELLIGLGIDKAKLFAGMIRDASDFELTSEPVLNLLTYRYVPPAAREVLRTGSEAQRELANLALTAKTLNWTG